MNRTTADVKARPRENLGSIPLERSADSLAAAGGRARHCPWMARRGGWLIGNLGTDLRRRKTQPLLQVRHVPGFNLLLRASASEGGDTVSTGGGAGACGLGPVPEFRPVQ